MKKYIASLIIITIAVVGAGLSIVLAPTSQNQAVSVRAASDGVVTQEYTVTFKTVDGEVLAIVTTVDARVPLDKIPNAPQILHRPFLRWTNVQGHDLGGIIQADITFLPLYSYDPKWEGDGSGPVIGNKEYKKTQWVWMNYIVTENQIILGAVFGSIILFFAVVIILKLLRGVFHK